MEWVQLTVTTTSECADVVAMLLMDLGSDGTSIKDRRDVEEVLSSKRNWDYADDSLLNMRGDCAFVCGFFADSFDFSKVYDELALLKERAGESAGSLEVSKSLVRDADWENEWRKYYEPIEIGNVAIVPKWLSYDGKCGVRVFMEPGMAFGTGKHETTSMCIELLQHIDVSGKRVLDMGCGSGILGVAALKLGAKSCVMSDIEQSAADSARENAEYNGVGERAEVYCGDLTEKICGSFDIVLANLTADILLRLKGLLSPLVKKGGYIVISGLIHARADEVLEAYSEGFELVKREKKGEWQAMLLKAK